MIQIDELKKSVEAKYHKGRNILYIACIIVLTIVEVVFVVFGSDKYTAPTFACGVALFMYVCALLYGILEYKSVIFSARELEPYTVTLTKSKRMPMTRGKRFYRISFTTNDGQEKTVDTAGLWGYGIFELSPDEYDGKEIKIGYNKEDERIVVIG